MAKVLTEEQNLKDIAGAIRNKLEVSTKYSPSEMADAIRLIEGYPEPFGSMSITENGVANVKDYEFADVNVQVELEPEDEGKVVSNGELVEQGSLDVYHNGSYDTTLKNSIWVDVANSYDVDDLGKVVAEVGFNRKLVSQTGTTITENGTYDTTTNDEVVVNVSGGSSAVIEPLSVTQNGTYTPPTGVDGYAPVTVNVSGGGGSNVLCDIDLTKISSAETLGNVYIDSQGAHFDGTNDYLSLPFARSGVTVEIDVATMALTSGSHRRFIMSGYSGDNGFIYRSSGVWAFYNGSWEEATFDGCHDGDFFANSVVKVIVDTNNLWHIYKNGVLVFEPSGAQRFDSNEKMFKIGATSYSINNALITGVRVY